MICVLLPLAPSKIGKEILKTKEERKKLVDNPQRVSKFRKLE